MTTVVIETFKSDVICSQYREGEKRAFAQTNYYVPNREAAVSRIINLFNAYPLARRHIKFGA